MTRPNIEHLDRLWEEATGMAKVDFQLREPMTEKQHKVMLIVQETFNSYPELSAYIRKLEREVRELTVLRGKEP